MPSEILFVHVEGKVDIAEVPLPELITEAEVYGALEKAGLLTGTDLLIFIDEAEECLSKESHGQAEGAKHGARVHVSRCRRLEVTVHFLNQTIERSFPPGTRVRTVKAWAANEFHVSHKDAAEHVLQICHSKERPVSDTPLHSLLHDCGCSICFDFVPEKRVEGHSCR